MSFLRSLMAGVVALFPAIVFAQGITTKIEFDSKTFRGYKAFIAGDSSSDERIFGYLSMPAEARGKVPAVIFLPHSGGYSENQDGWYRAALNTEGIATFFVDGFSPRGLSSPIMVRDISFATVVADAYAALATLAKRSDIDASRIALAGFSRGAEATRQAAFESFRKAAGAGELRFAAHVPLYPLCVTSMRSASDMTGAPMLILAAAKDDITPPKNCEDYVTFMKSQNPAYPVVVRVYPNAYHGWDDQQNTGEYRKNAPSGADCIPIFLSPQGEFIAMLRDGREVPFERSILKCPGRGGILTFDATLRERSTRELIEFVKARFNAVK